MTIKDMQDNQLLAELVRLLHQQPMIYTEPADDILIELDNRGYTIKSVTITKQIDGKPLTLSVTATSD